MPPQEKAEAYVELAEAASGEAMLAGEAAEFEHALGQDGWSGPLMQCNSDELEVITAVLGLGRVLEDDHVAVRLAMQRSPAILSVLCTFLAYTPELRHKERGDESIAWSFEGELKEADWSFEGAFTPQQIYDGTNYKGENCAPVRVCDFTQDKAVERYLELSPPQSSACYCHVMRACLELLALAADAQFPHSDSTLCRLQASACFAPCVQRLMELVGR